MSTLRPKLKKRLCTTLPLSIRKSFCFALFQNVRSRYEITQQLIAAGADVNAKDQEQETPLHESTAYGAVGVTQLLLINGSDQNAKAENGLTPKEYICRCNTYVSDPTLTQCAPNKCTRDYDKRVLEHIFEVYNGEA